MKMTDKELKEKEFAIALLACLTADSELTEEEAKVFVKAYAKDLFGVATGTVSSGLLSEEIEDEEIEY
jgi:hypothetical protein